jgi:predicted nuclease of predicted toxin-antitoxin system
VKFLIDNQLPAALADYLKKRGFDCEHVLHLGLGEASDTDICEYAIAQKAIIVSKDQDFLYLASKSNADIKLIWVRLGNCRTSALLEAFDRLWPEIQASLNAGDRVIEIR